jgi:hypothetical protein
MVGQAIAAIKTGSNKEKNEERKETQDNFKIYFNKLKDIGDAKLISQEINNIPKDILTREQKAKLRKDILEFRKNSFRSEL